MGRWYAGLAVVALSVGLVGAQERIDLAVPETPPANVNYALVGVQLDYPGGRILIDLAGANGETLHCRYTSTTTPTGATLLVALNKANLSSAYAGNATTGSLKQRIYHRLAVMGEATAVCGRSLAGTLAGSVP